MAEELLRVHCPRCGGALLRYVDPLTDDTWLTCLEEGCDYARSDND